MSKSNPCVPISPPHPDIFQAFTSSDVPRVGHFLFVGCPRVGDFSDSSITFTKHMMFLCRSQIPTNDQGGDWGDGHAWI